MSFMTPIRVVPFISARALLHGNARTTARIGNARVMTSSRMRPDGAFRCELSPVRLMSAPAFYGKKSSWEARRPAIRRAGCGQVSQGSVSSMAAAVEQTSRILVAGGGIGGLAAALGLARKGRSVL